MLARSHVRCLPALGLLATIMRSPCSVHPLFTPHGRPAALLMAVWRACGARHGHRDGPGITRSDEQSKFPPPASGCGKCACGRQDRDLPGRDHPAPHHRERRHLRGRLPGLPAAPAVHHRQRRAHPAPARTRRPAARRPRGLGRRPGAAPGLHGAPAPRRADHRPRSPPGGDAASSSATAERPATTPGSSAAPPR
jgi:hypothetical protein